ncbi:OmpA family protein [Thiohalomonas denitrificans]|uniref:Outer membrane protein OmpA n=1 Tax=Thiohalomonas denitrificans TaxID=415747 RepID=A0A1G5Q7X2_9GAMM|nr:OmpA family protein [Thiohalomonas denitrificans]SCZ57964.1 Outer membrane protein OmpA [Thiohalomonas denitrificans]
MKPISRSLLIAPLTLLLVACATGPTEDLALQEVRERHSQLSTDRQVQSTAPDALFDAQQALARAVQAEDDEASRNHQLYLANQHMNIAEATANRKQLDSSIKSMAEQTDQLRLRARERELEEAKSELAALKAEQTERGLLVTLNDVFFDTGQATLKQGAASTIDQLAEFMRKHSEQRILIEGHTDSRGPEEYNQRLSERRAAAVQEALVSRGIDSGRIRTRGYGETRPIASNETSGGRQLNRRVEIVFPEYREF